MRQTVNADTLALINGVTNYEPIALNTITVKRGTDPGIEWQFARKELQAAIELELTAIGQFTADAATDVITVSLDHGLVVGNVIRFATSDTLPAPLVADQDYYVKTVPGARTLTVSLTSGGATVDLTDSGTGAHSLSRFDALEYFKFGAKVTNQFDSEYIISNYDPDSASYLYTKSGVGESALYTVAPSFDNDALNALLLHDGNPANDIAQVDLAAEIKWRIAGKRQASLTFVLRIVNDINKGTEAATPSPNPEPIDYLKTPKWEYGLTSYTGGGPLALDGLTPGGSAYPLNSMVITRVGGVMKFHHLRLRTGEGENEPFYIIPDSNDIYLWESLG